MHTIIHKFLEKEIMNYIYKNIDSLNINQLEDESL